MAPRATWGERLLRQSHAVLYCMPAQPAALPVDLLQLEWSSSFFRSCAYLPVALLFSRTQGCRPCAACSYVLSHSNDPQILPLIEAAVEARTELHPVLRNNRWAPRAVGALANKACR